MRYMNILTLLKPSGTQRRTITNPFCNGLAVVTQHDYTMMLIYNLLAPIGFVPLHISSPESDPVTLIWWLGPIPLLPPCLSYLHSALVTLQHFPVIARTYPFHYPHFLHPYLQTLGFEFPLAANIMEQKNRCNPETKNEKFGLLTILSFLPPVVPFYLHRLYFYQVPPSPTISFSNWYHP